MKKAVTPLLIAAAVFTVSLIAQRYTLICQEYDGLFLAVPDYFRQLFRKPLPLSHLVTDFLTQFFRFSVYGPAILAVLVTAVFLLLRRLLSAVGLQLECICALGALGLWVWTASRPTVLPLVAALLFLAAAVLLTLPLKARKPVRMKDRHDLSLSSAIVLCAVGALLSFPAVRRAETWAKVKHATAYAQWDLLLESATPERAEKNRVLTPFALLALNEKGLLADQMLTYPVTWQSDLDMAEQGDSYESLFFRAALYDRLGCGNESIHNLFQLSNMQEHGTSFLILRQLALQHYRIGNYVLAEKYCRILERSSLHGQYVRYIRDCMAAGEPRPQDAPARLAEAPLITHDPLRNILLIENEGIHSPISLERVLCTLLLRRNLDGFWESLDRLTDRSARLPRHYQEALLLAGAAQERVDPQLAEQYSRFQADFASLSAKQLHKRYGTTYWFYYIFYDQQNHTNP
ncbi:MAG: hypothetical protein IJK55_08950 [Bacteroidales bacterium]|nr:hypothetical protein [Bacteroidales bacterium]